MKRLFISLAVAMVLVAVMVTPAMAASDSGTTEITGNVVATIDVTAPAAITGQTWSVGSNTMAFSDLVVSSNAIWNVAVKDALDDAKPSGTEGEMAEWDGSSYVSAGRVLTNSLTVKVGTETAVTLSDTDQNLWASNQNPTGGTYSGEFGQTIDSADWSLSGGNVYRIVVTFTATTY